MPKKTFLKGAGHQPMRTTKNTYYARRILSPESPQGCASHRKPPLVAVHSTDSPSTPRRPPLEDNRVGSYPLAGPRGTKPKDSAQSTHSQMLARTHKHFDKSFVRFLIFFLTFL